MMTDFTVLQRPLLRSLMVMGEIIEARDPYTGGHVWRITQLAKRLAQAVGADDSVVLKVTIGGWLHDIGKVAVPDAILGKRARLDEDEFSIVKQHTTIGHDLMADHPMAELVIDAVTYHHERYDGGGYPEGASGDHIPEVARLIAVVDAFDAMTSSRPYGNVKSVSEASYILRQEAGRQFDPRLAETFAALADGGAFDDVVGHVDFDRPLMLCPNCGSLSASSCGEGDDRRCRCEVCAGEFLVRKIGLVPAVKVGDAQPSVRSVPRPDLGRIDHLLGTLCGRPEHTSGPSG